MSFVWRTIVSSHVPETDRMRESRRSSRNYWLRISDFIGMWYRAGTGNMGTHTSGPLLHPSNLRTLTRREIYFTGIQCSMTIPCHGNKKNNFEKFKNSKTPVYKRSIYKVLWENVEWFSCYGAETDPTLSWDKVLLVAMVTKNYNFEKFKNSNRHNSSL